MAKGGCHGDGGGGAVLKGDGGGQGEGRKGCEAGDKGKERGEMHFEYFMTFPAWTVWCGCVECFVNWKTRSDGPKALGGPPSYTSQTAGITMSLWLIEEFATARPSKC